MAGEVGTNQIAAGALAASVAGRAIVATGFFNETKATDAFGAASIADSLIKSYIEKNPGSVAVGGYYLSGAAHADTDTFTIDGRVYELDGGGGITGDIAVTPGGAGPWSSANTIIALVTAINNDASRTVDAINLGGDIIGLVGKTLTGTNPALAHGGAGTATVLGAAAAMAGGAAAVVKQVLAGEHTITANEFNALASAFGTEILLVAFPSTSAPRLRAVGVHTSAGVVGSAAGLTVTLVAVNGNFYALKLQESIPAILAATDVVTYEIEL